jgi:hypothetical protein
MDLRNLTKEQFIELAEEEAKASINIGRRPHPSAFGIEQPGEVLEMVLANPKAPMNSSAGHKDKRKIS